MIGANDLGQSFNVNSAPERLASLLENIFGRLPDGGMVLVCLSPTSMHEPKGSLCSLKFMCFFLLLFGYYSGACVSIKI